MWHCTFVDEVIYGSTLCDAWSKSKESLDAWEKGLEFDKQDGDVNDLAMWMEGLFLKLDIFNHRRRIKSLVRAMNPDLTFQLKVIYKSSRRVPQQVALKKKTSSSCINHYQPGKGTAEATDEAAAACHELTAQMKLFSVNLVITNCLTGNRSNSYRYSQQEIKSLPIPALFRLVTVHFEPIVLASYRPLVSTADVWAANGKRALSSTTVSNISRKPLVKRNRNVQDPGPMKPRKKRSPDAMVQVPLENLDIWESLCKTPAPLSYAHWIALDSSAAKSVQGGTRFLRSRARKKHMNQEVQGQVNFVDDDQEEELSGASDFDDYLFEDNDTSFVEQLTSCNPVDIGGHPLNAVPDTCASVSVISTALATRLGIQAIEDSLSLNGLLPIKQEAGRVCPNVNISIAGHHRPEHFVLQQRESDLLLLGMTFIKLPVNGEGHVNTENDVFLVSTTLMPSMVNNVDESLAETKKEAGSGDEPKFQQNLTSLVAAEDVMALLKEHKDVFVEHASPARVDVTEHETNPKSQVSCWAAEHNFDAHYQHGKLNPADSFPALLLYGMEMRTPSTWPAPRSNYGFLPRLWKDATLSGLRVKKSAKERYDKHVVLKQFQIGQLVKYLNPNPNTKFDDKFVGPYRVFKKLWNNTYLLASL
ncbi:hypothetical protein INT44_007147 [Umbelopsis vinacea]|uniref:Uncharacterized protein n=1 Tax=Umbelopsis vinacea TaxID=44442 RepID=A0A8H7U794_9FUNG|nr:hypothetical protein INT44_007147 [Umbelopsis vinacea]